MTMYLNILLSLLVFVTSASSRCPMSQDLPREYNKYKFFCARVYEHSHYISDFSCGGAFKNIWNGERAQYVGKTWNDRVSSLVVRPGCKLTVWEHDGYRGRKRDFTGQQSRLQNHRLRSGFLGFGRSNWNDRISSWICNCEFTNEALTCRPREEFQVMNVCNNPSEEEMTCKHNIQKGMAIGSSATKGHSVSTSIEASIGEAIKDAFLIGLPSSITKFYRWSRSDNKTFSKVTSSQAMCDVTPGGKVTMMQVVGKCGNTTVYSGHYECR